MTLGEASSKDQTMLMKSMRASALILSQVGEESGELLAKAEGLL